MDRVRIGCNYENKDPEELEKLHPDDKQNPIWNEKGEE